MIKKQVRIRCWVEIDGARFFGPGPAELLEEIENEGSISRASRKMGMSYKKAWDIVTKLNSFSENKFVEPFKGGDKGGKALVTPHAKKTIERYRMLMKKLNAVIEKDSFHKWIN